jgi:hypothetical protein
MSGYLYFLSNAAFPTLLKVGQTSDTLEQRIRQLNSTGVPFPFLLEACFRVENPKQAELTAHEALDRYRSSKNREFFKIDLQPALKIVFPKIVDTNLSEASSIRDNKQFEPPISKSELEILQWIVSAGSSRGLAQWTLYDKISSTELEIDVVLSKLEHKKFVKCNRTSSDYGPNWLPTTKGIKFLSDNNLIEEWMHRRW